MPAHIQSDPAVGIALDAPLEPILLTGALTDLARTKSELIAENALLRQQLIILRRQVMRPPCTRSDLRLLPGTPKSWLRRWR